MSNCIEVKVATEMDENKDEEEGEERRGKAFFNTVSVLGTVGQLGQTEMKCGDQGNNASTAC